MSADADDDGMAAFVAQIGDDEIKSLVQGDDVEWVFDGPVIQNGIRFVLVYTEETNPKLEKSDR